MLIKTDGSGVVQWSQRYWGEVTGRGRSLVETSDGGYAITGLAQSFSAGDADLLMVKTDEFGVVPEAAWVVLPLLLIATLPIFVIKKKLLYRQYGKKS